MRVRFLSPELRLTASHVIRRSPEHSAHSGMTATRRGRGLGDNRIVDDDEASAACCALARCPSCVDGLRARLKPGRFWFDSRGGHRGSAAPRRSSALLKRRARFDSERTHRTSRKSAADGVIWDHVAVGASPTDSTKSNRVPCF
jgi:hypothetical protein